MNINDRSRSLGPLISEKDDDLIICRCEEIRKGEIRQAIHDGMFTMTEIRRYLRTGMGLCQGQSCTRMVKNILAKELQMNPAKIHMAASRAPMRPLEMEIFAKEEGL